MAPFGSAQGPPSAPLRDRHFILEKIDETPIKLPLLTTYIIYGRGL